LSDRELLLGHILLVIFQPFVGPFLPEIEVRDEELRKKKKRRRRRRRRMQQQNQRLCDDERRVEQKDAQNSTDTIRRIRSR
jgi:hypothetical protein